MTHIGSKERSRSPTLHGHAGPSSKRKHRGLTEEGPPAKKKLLQHMNGGSDSDESASHTAMRPRKVRLRQEHKYPSVNELKRRIRDVKRLLARVDLPADARIVQERALSNYEKDLADELARRQRSELIKRYHFVRFLERKVATKELKRLVRREEEIRNNKKSDSNEANLAHLAQKIHTARVNLNYTIYYPLDQKYVSLFPNKKQILRERESEQAQTQATRNSNSETDEQKIAESATADVAKSSAVGQEEKKPTMWYAIEKCMEEGTLQLLRDGKLQAGLDRDGVVDGLSQSKPSSTEHKTGAPSTKHGRRSKSTVAPETAKDIKSRLVGNSSRSRSRKKDEAQRNNGNGRNENAEVSDGGFFEE